MYDRSSIGSHLPRYYFLFAALISLSANLELVGGRRCVCTSKACKEAGRNVCETKYSCYTELIVTDGQGNSITRGCTEGATPLFCETKSWVTRSSDALDRPSSAPWIRMPWPRLECCDTLDYCNADHGVDLATWISGNGRHEPADTSSTRLNGSSSGARGPSSRETMGPIQPERGPIAGSRESPDQLLQHRVKPLHVAALVLAIAALISVLAACYVITRFLNTNPYLAGSVE